MKTLTLALAIAALGCSCHAGAVELTEFTLLQNFSVQTLVCNSFSIVGDESQYGNLNATGCTTTGPILSQGDGTLGNFTINVRVGVGPGSVRYVIEGCRLDAYSGTYGYYHYTINCSN